jgi:hypothetical protein
VDKTKYSQIGYVSEMSVHSLLHCGVRNRNTTNRYLEILCFQHFARFMTFTADGNDFKNKLLKDKIEVSVVLDLDLDVECVDML